MTIASAVEEQTATTTEMSRGIGDSAVSSSQIADGIASISQVASQSAEVTHQVTDAVEELAKMSADLHKDISGLRF